MNVVQLLEDTKDTILAYSDGGGGFLFKEAGLYTHMKALKDNKNPSVWITPHKVSSSGSDYTGSTVQKKDHYFAFNIACRLEDLDACQKALSNIYTGYEYVDSDDLARNNPYSQMEHVGGELIDTHSVFLLWGEVYTTFKVGG